MNKASNRGLSMMERRGFFNPLCAIPLYDLVSLYSLDTAIRTATTINLPASEIAIWRAALMQEIDQQQGCDKFPP